MIPVMGTKLFSVGRPGSLGRHGNRQTGTSFLSQDYQDAEDARGWEAAKETAMNRDGINLALSEVLTGSSKCVLLHGNAVAVLKGIPSGSVECAVTSPPYWKLREYEVHTKHNGVLIGNESRPEEYVANLMLVFTEIKRVLKPDGSFWLNIGDKFYNKNLMGMPWRVALGMQQNGWIIRSDIIWDQMKGTQSCKDRMRDSYEHVFHFVKEPKYYFDADAVRIKPSKTSSMNGNTPVSATGVSGVRYRQLIRESTALSVVEKGRALEALEAVIEKMRNGEIVDFRMTIRGRQRTYHSESTKISGRAKELQERGYFFLMMKSKGFLPSDIWRIVPEDEWRKDSHCAVFPEELLSIPIKATSRINGIVLDPFVGTGSTVAAALKLHRRGIGIDLSDHYLSVAQARISSNGHGQQHPDKQQHRAPCAQQEALGFTASSQCS